MYQEHRTPDAEQQQLPPEEPVSFSSSPRADGDISIFGGYDDSNNERDNASSRTGSSSNRKLYLLTVAIVVVMSLIVAIAVPLSKDSNGNDDTSKLSSSASTQGKDTEQQQQQRLPKGISAPEETSAPTTMTVVAHTEDADNTPFPTTPTPPTTPPPSAVPDDDGEMTTPFPTTTAPAVVTTTASPITSIPATSSPTPSPITTSPTGLPATSTPTTVSPTVSPVPKDDAETNNTTTPGSSLLQVVASQDDLSTLYTALTSFENLAAILSGDSDNNQNNTNIDNTTTTTNVTDDSTETLVNAFTLFAPTNEAFGHVNPNLLTKLLTQTDEYQVHLEQLLVFHMSGQVLWSDNITDGLQLNLFVYDTNSQMDNVTASVDVDDESGVRISFQSDYFNSSQMIQADLMASNGVVHKVNRVFVPSVLVLNLWERLSSSTASSLFYSFTTLTDWIVRAGLEELLASPDDAWTVFAPADNVLAAMDPTVVDMFQQASPEQLETVVLSHVVQGIWYQERLLGANGTTTELMTLGGQVLSIAPDSMNNTSLAINGVVTVISYDHVASNGMFHVLDGVLLLPTINNNVTAVPNATEAVTLAPATMAPSTEKPIEVPIPTPVPPDKETEVPTTNAPATSIPVVTSAPIAPIPITAVPTPLPTSAPITPAPITAAPTPMPTPLPTNPPVPTPLTSGCTPCTQPSDCHDVNNVAGLNEACGETSCLGGTCQFEAWADSGACGSSNFVECEGDDAKCTKGPSGVKYEGTCTGFDNNECIYTWCPGDQGGPTTAPPPTTPPPPRPTSIWQPKPKTTWQWQISGTVDTSFDVDMYDIDLFDVPQNVIDKLHSDGRIVVCYFSAGSFENWRSDAGLFSQDLLGSPLGDWPGEWWLDIRNIDLLGPIMQARMDLAVAKRCDAVEPDNIDGYQNNNGLGLSYNDQLTYNRWLAAEAHQRGLSIGLKNDLDQVTQLVDNFDWALNEECFQYNECDRLLPFVNAGKAVFGVEYEGDPADFCPQFNSMQFSWLKKNWDLDATILADCIADY